MKPNLRGWGQALVDVLFPPQCAACGALGREPFCPACAVSVEPAAALHIDGLDAARAAWTYGGAVSRAVSRLKYEGRVDLARPLGRALAPLVEGLGADLLVPVPLSDARLRQRGFNQARELVRSLGRPTAVDALRRRDTGAAQVGRSIHERRRGLRAALSADPARVAGRKILLIDDVVTTGTTARAAGSALRRAGARWVGVVALAATPRWSRRLAEGVESAS